MGRSADLPIQDHFWRHVRQKCIFREGTLAFPEKNEFMPVRKFVSQGANFRVPSPLVEKPQFFNEKYYAAGVKAPVAGSKVPAALSPT